MSCVSVPAVDEAAVWNRIGPRICNAGKPGIQTRITDGLHGTVTGPSSERMTHPRAFR